MDIINRSQYLQTVVSSARRGNLATFEITIPSVKESPMFFHSVTIVEEAITAKDLKCFRWYPSGSLFRYTMQKISKMWTASAAAANLAPFAKLVSSYNLFDSAKERFFVLRKRQQGFAPCEQSHHLFHGMGAVNNEAIAENAV